MICIALGLGALGFLAARRARGWHRCDSDPWHHHHRFGWARRGSWRHGRRHRSGLFWALSHLDLTPAQERAIVAEADKLGDRLRAARATIVDGRADLAAAVRAPALDDAALGAVLGRVDSATGEARAAAVEALRNIHGVLDEGQRERLAELLDRSWWRRGGGPYRV